MTLNRASRRGRAEQCYLMNSGRLAGAGNAADIQRPARSVVERGLHKVADFVELLVATR